MKLCWWHKKIKQMNPAVLWQMITAKSNDLIPRHCLFCLQKTHSSLDLCPHCIADLSLNTLCCQRCALPLEHVSPDSTTLCGNCLSHDYYYDQVFSPFHYSDDLAYLIKKLKYQQKIHYAGLLAKLFIEQADAHTDFQLPQAIIPIPMHSKRLKSRGYNQALELSRIFSYYYQLPLDYTSLIRHRYTQLQAEMNASKRQKNVKNAFLLKQAMSYSHIVLVDDVMTTGSTVNEAAKVLKKSGIKRVDIWTIARAGWKH